MTKRFEWEDTSDGGAEMKTNALRLTVKPFDIGWECIVYNAGRYSRLYESKTPVLGALAEAKRFCKTAAFYVLKDEQAALEAIEG